MPVNSGLRSLSFTQQWSHVVKQPSFDLPFKHLKMQKPGWERSSAGRCLPSTNEALFQYLVLREPGMTTHTFNPSAWETGEGRPKVILSHKGSSKLSELLLDPVAKSKTPAQCVEACVYL